MVYNSVPNKLSYLLREFIRQTLKITLRSINDHNESGCQWIKVINGQHYLKKLSTRSAIRKVNTRDANKFRVLTATSEPKVSLKTVSGTCGRIKQLFKVSTTEGRAAPGDALRLCSQSGQPKWGQVSGHLKVGKKVRKLHLSHSWRLETFQRSI